MICNKCGTNVPDESMYCMNCGNKLSRINYYDTPGGSDDTPGGDTSSDSDSLRAYYEDVSFARSEPKSKVTAGLLGIFLGAFGVHRFYLGYTGVGIAQIAVSVITCGLAGGIWGFIEGLCILCDVGITVDANGNRLE